MIGFSVALALHLSRTFAAPPDAVFPAWTDADAIREWFVDGADVHWSGIPVIDARPGGRFQWTVVANQNEKERFSFHGTYSAVDPRKGLRFSWEWESLPIPGVGGPGHTVVTITFVAKDSVTEIMLTQTGFANAAARRAHEKGWRRCFDGIDHLLAATRGGPSSAPVMTLEHVRVIDGTGAPARPDQTIVMGGGNITMIGDARVTPIPAGAVRNDLNGYSVFPGLVGMHDHLFYSVNFFGSDGVRAYDMPFSYPRLYLAAGVTTIRTTGAFEPYTDLEIKKSIEAGTLIGPKMNVTGPYLEGEPLPRIQIHKLGGPDDARRTVEYWADEGAGSFKAYADITHAELAAAIAAAHERGLTITGHLCSIGFREAAEMGIDGIEHGLFVDTEFTPDKRPDVCPDEDNASAANLEIGSDTIQAMIRTLVEHHVAVTSTLPVWEEFIPQRRGAPARVLRALSPDARRAYAAQRLLAARDTARSHRFATMLRKEMAFERAFVRAGGLLLAGPDGVVGSDIAGFGDQRELEMLVEAGFTPLEAIEIGSLNGAKFLRLSDRVGSLAVGKAADIVVVRGDPSTDIRAVENVAIVFKDGVGYDARALIESVTGLVGIR